MSGNSFNGNQAPNAEQPENQKEQRQNLLQNKKDDAVQDGHVAANCQTVEYPQHYHMLWQPAILSNNYQRMEWCQPNMDVGGNRVGGVARQNPLPWLSSDPSLPWVVRTTSLASSHARHAGERYGFLPPNTEGILHGVEPSTSRQFFSPPPPPYYNPAPIYRSPSTSYETPAHRYERNLPYRRESSQRRQGKTPSRESISSQPERDKESPTNTIPFPPPS